MAIATLTAYKTAVNNPIQMTPFQIAPFTPIAGRLHDLWLFSYPVATQPSTAAVPTNATTGSIGQQDSASLTLGIVGGSMQTVLMPGAYIVIDRLSHQGGLSGIVATAQTTNLPTSALTRYTSGVGVMAGLSIYSQIGATSTTVTASYTNQAGTAAQITTAVAFGNTGFREATRMILLPLASGDTGVRAVASVTQAATTGTAGSYGVTLFKPLYVMIVDGTHNVSYFDYVTGNSFGGIPEALDGACLSILAIPYVSTTSAQGSGFLFFKEH